MKCQSARDCIVLLNYGELPDELAGVLEQHLIGCEDCTEELEAFQGFEERLATMPVLEPSPNLLAQSRMRLDDALDMIPPHGFLTQLRINFYRWIGNVQSAPALATLLLGVGFLTGNFTHRYQVRNTPPPKTPGPTVTLGHPAEGVIANVTGIVQTPNSELVQVNYNRIVPESMEGSLDSPDIRNLLMVGTNAAATPGVRMNSVSLLTNECKAGHACHTSDRTSMCATRYWRRWHTIGMPRYGVRRSDCLSRCSQIRACGRCCGRSRRRMRILISGRRRTTRCRTLLIFSKVR